MKFLFVFFLLFSTLSHSRSLELERIRSIYLEAENSYQDLLELHDITDYKSINPVVFSYNISAKLMMLRYSFNPVRKYLDFKKNTFLIDSVIVKNPYNLEIRLLRYAIQKMSPSFLNYKKNIRRDFDIINDQFDSLDSQSREYFSVVLNRISSE